MQLVLRADPAPTPVAASHDHEVKAWLRENAPELLQANEARSAAKLDQRSQQH